MRKKAQQTLFGTAELLPAEIRVEFDMAICKTLGVPMTENELHKIIVDEMMITRGLTKD